jgi:hypothetical protein
MRKSIYLILRREGRYGSKYLYVCVLHSVVYITAMYIISVISTSLEMKTEVRALLMKLVFIY